MSRFSATLLLLLALLVGPALCMGGLIEHSCECGGDTELQCDHEDDCAGDLCSTFSIPKKDGNNWQLDLDLLWLPVQPIVVQVFWLESGLPVELPSLNFQRSPGLPYLPSDRPQLI